MGPNFFPRPVRSDDPDSEFAATVLSLPPETAPRGSARSDFGPHFGSDFGPDSGPDSRPDGGTDSAPASLPPDSGLDSLPAGAEPAHGAAGAPARTTPAALEQAPTLRHIGRYALKAPLGSGGLGQVHEAWDPLLSRPVAVKTLHLDVTVPVSGPSLENLFLHEARAAARLNHPNIVTVFDAGMSPHGAYIAMERLSGRDLRHALAAGWQPTPLQAAQLVRRVADALAYAHARGVVHCDIKPANIFITPNDKPKVLDFGIARVAQGAAHAGMAGLPGLDGMIVGSPHYLAPEQLQGGAVDARTDLHALGAVLHELLCGRKAFDGRSAEQIMQSVLAGAAVPAHEVLPGVPQVLSAIAARAMSREPAERYGTAAEMAADLRRWAQTQSTPARTASADRSRTRDATPRTSGTRQPTPAKAGTAKGRRALAWAAALGVAAAVAAVAAVALRQGPADTGRGPADATAAAPSLPTAGLPAMGAAVPPLPEVVATAGSPAPGSEPAVDPGAAAASDTPALTPPITPQIAPPLAPPLTLPVTLPVTPPLTPPLTPAAGNPPVGASPVPTAGRTAIPTTATRPTPRRTTAPTTAREAPRDSPRTAGTATAAAATGTVRLAISPWGEVEVDGKPVGTTPPLTQLSLPPGRHLVTVHNADFPPHSVTVEVDADRPATVRHRFGP